jgi:hypothetical protein
MLWLAIRMSIELVLKSCIRNFGHGVRYGVTLTVLTDLIKHMNDIETAE